MNIIGIISIRNLPASLTASSFIAPVISPINIITIPYILAGIGNGSIYFNNSPTKVIPMITIN